MKKEHEILFTPMHIGNVEIKNRFIMCPMEGTSIVESLYGIKFKKESHDFFIDRAKDGVGLYIPGMACLRSFIGDKWLHEQPEVFEPLPELMEEMHSYGTKVFIQLGAGWGRSYTLSKVHGKLIDSPLLRKLAKPVMNMDNVLIAPSDSPNVWMPQYQHRAMTVKEIHEFVNAYAKSAKLCRDYGADGVEVHAVHEGYLMDQFTMKYSNHRTDEYGGSFENRYRFAVEVVQAIKKECGDDFPVSLRYSVVSKTKGYNSGAVPGEEFVEAGRDMEESERAIAYLREAGYDAFNCDNGTYDAWYWAHPPVYMPPNCNLEDVRHIKKFTDAPVFCAGRMEIDDAAQAISAGELDGVGIGRQFLCDERTITKIREGRIEDIRPCISCHIACIPISATPGSGFKLDMNEVKAGRTNAGRCSLNPYCFNEKKYAIVPAKHPKKIAVIGGGVGGMEAAIQAAKRGHTVDLYEKTNELGGTFIAAAASECKEKDRQLIEWYKREIAKVPVNVHMNTEIKSLDTLRADEIIVATGATPKRLPVTGGDRAIFVTDALRGKTELGENVVIVGGGLAGCELAYDLALKGKKPVIVEMQEVLIKDVAVSAVNAMLMRDLIRYHNIPTHLNTRLCEIRDGEAVIETDGVRTVIPADSVVSAAGFTPGSPLAEKAGKHVHIIGDADHVAHLKAAIWDANDLILKLSK